MHLLDLPQFAQFADRRDVKVLRHKDTKRDLWALRTADKRCAVLPNSEDKSFDAYQRNQSWDVFSDATHIISFIAERHRFARFVGVWEVLATTPKKKTRGFRYRTREAPGFASLEGRLVVAWGDGTRSWAQRLHTKGNKSISEILPPNYVMDFGGYYDFALTYDQLSQMIANPESNREWYRMLRSVSGVYLIVDQTTGEQYVGSAYGVGGIWGRWKAYTRNPSGGNVRLKQLLARSPGRHKAFQFSILRVLEPGVTKDAVIEQECWAKRKLGCRAHGLNGN